MKRITFTLFCLLASLVSYGFAQEVAPLEQAHAHNDYEHERPLYDALSHGFTSVEADIWLVFDQLFVAHDAHEIQEGKTLQSLYLDPLRERIAENGGSVYPEGGTLTLLIDIKTNDEATYQALHEVLAQYDDIFTSFTGDQIEEGPVTAIISGNRPREQMEAQATRYAGYDGRMDDLGAGDSASFIPLISDNWTKFFTWTGEGEMPQAERQELERIVETAHANGQRVRFWATPDEAGAARENLWNVLAEVGVDHLNTDDLAGLETFLRARETMPAQ